MPHTRTIISLILEAKSNNENFPMPVVEGLRRLGHDVLTIHETGQTGTAMPDEAVLRFATEQERALLTLNRKHFVALHLRHPHHAGIVVCTFDPDFTRQAQQIHEAIQSRNVLAGELIRVNRPA
jgi:hypothetical protein